MMTFSFHRPASIAEALQLVRAQDGKYLSGGQSLIPMLKLDLAATPAVVSLAAIAELRGIRRDGDTLVIGAAATHAEVAASDVVRNAIPAVAALASHIGDPQVRNRGTLGGSLAHADPAADYPAALVALAGTVVTDRREIAADDFFRGMFTTALQNDEIITAVRFPVPQRAAYAKFASPASRFAIVGVFVARTTSGVRVAVTGAASKVFRPAGFEAALESSFAASALDGIMVDPGDLITNADAAADYRAHLVAVMAKRAVRAASAA
ncbi:MAG: FAD binding domain-containing protein [Gemmatimonadetes bacterium]|nr:FAD binding domain-containing protein [Gemmatimonadota bacterium]